MNSVILEARSLTKEYKQTLALDHINLQIKRVKFMVLSVGMGLARLLFKTGHGTCISDKRHAFLMGKIRNCGITETA